MSEDQNGYYGYEDKVNDAISIGNFLWLATSKGVIKINQTTRKRTEYKEDSIPSNEVESIDANKKGDIWIGTYGKRMAFMDEAGEWVDVPYDLSLFKEYKDTVEKDGQILLEGDEDNWLRTNYIHFDANDTLWVGTSIGLLKLQYEEGKPTWEGPFNPNAGTEPLNVLFIGDLEGGIEISGNYGKRGYKDVVEEEIRTYRLPNVISAEDTNWRAMSQEAPTEDTAGNEAVTEDVVEEEATTTY